MTTSSQNIARKKLLLEYDSSIGQALRDLRKERDLKQTDLADDLGARQSSLSKIEAGQRSLRACEIALYAQALGMTREELWAAISAAMDERDTLASS